MRPIYTIFLILAFISITVFGFLGMQHNSGHGPTGCIAVMAKGVNCPLNANSFLFAFFHLDTLKSFSTATLNYSHFNILALLAFIVLLLSWLSYFRIGSYLLLPATKDYRQNTYFIPLQQNLACWLALHENSPTDFKTSV